MSGAHPSISIRRAVKEALDEAAALEGRIKKIDELRALMAAGDWRGAVSLASKFPQLGAHKARIMRAQEAYVRPGFQRQLGRNPDALIADGIGALKERYCNG